MPTKTARRYNPICATIDFHLKRCHRHRTELKGGPRNMRFAHRQLPDPWLFDSERLLNELDRIRELGCHIPVTGDSQALHFGTQSAIDALWHLREQIRNLLALHIDGQRAFAKKVKTNDAPTAQDDRSTPKSPLRSDPHPKKLRVRALHSNWPASQPVGH